MIASDRSSNFGGFELEATCGREPSAGEGETAAEILTQNAKQAPAEAEGPCCETGGEGGI